MNQMETMDYEELKKKLPPYFFMAPKKKARYFKTITTEYMTKLKKTEHDKAKTTRVIFQLEQSKTKCKPSLTLSIQQTPQSV